MKKTELLLFLACALSMATQAQKLVHTYYDYRQLHVHETFYTDNAGNKNGAYTEYSENEGIVKQGTYRNNLEEGKWVFKSSDGTPQSEETYKDGVKEGPATYYNVFGSLESTGSYKDGKKEGTWKYHEILKYKNVDNVYQYFQTSDPSAIPDFTEVDLKGCEYIQFTKSYHADQEEDCNSRPENYYPSGKIYLQQGCYNGHMSQKFYFFPNGRVARIVVYDTTTTYELLIDLSWHFPKGISKDSALIYANKYIEKGKAQDQDNKLAAYHDYAAKRRMIDSLCRVPHSYDVYHTAYQMAYEILRNDTSESSVPRIGRTSIDSLKLLRKQLDYFMNSYDKLPDELNNMYGDFIQNYSVRQEVPNYKTGGTDFVMKYPHGEQLFTKCNELLKSLMNSINGQTMPPDRYNKAMLAIKVLKKLNDLASSDTKTLDDQMKAANSDADVLKILGIQ